MPKGDLATMIELYTWPTPNGHKVQMMLEETGLPYEVIPVDITRGEQFADAYLAINPNNKVPTIVDRAVDRDGPDGSPYAVMETGAILLYLAEKAGRFLPTGAAPSDRVARHDVIQWLMWQMGGLGPMMGQAQHFHSYAPEDVPYARDRYRKEALRLLNVLDRRLEGRDFICGDYSIADMACFPWVRVHKMGGLTLEGCANVSRWYGAIRGRPATGRAIALLMDRYVAIADSTAAQAQLFGGAQYEKH